jgi:hypothetical protein
MKQTRVPATLVAGCSTLLNKTITTIYGASAITGG